MEADPVYVTTAQIAQRWGCSPETVFARLGKAGLAEYRFSKRVIRWKLVDVIDFEDSCKKPTRHTKPASAAEVTTHVADEPSNKRGPRHLRHTRSTNTNAS